jgi:hypothetical protein
VPSDRNEVLSGLRLVSWSRAPVTPAHLEAIRPVGPRFMHYLHGLQRDLLASEAPGQRTRLKHADVIEATFVQ